MMKPPHRIPGWPEEYPAAVDLPNGGFFRRLPVGECLDFRWRAYAGVWIALVLTALPPVGFPVVRRFVYDWTHEPIAGENPAVLLFFLFFVLSVLGLVVALDALLRFPRYGLAAIGRSLARRRPGRLFTPDSDCFMLPLIEEERLNWRTGLPEDVAVFRLRGGGWVEMEAGGAQARFRAEDIRLEPVSRPGARGTRIEVSFGERTWKVVGFLYYRKSLRRFEDRLRRVSA